MRTTENRESLQSLMGATAPPNGFFLPLFPWGRLPIEEPIDFETKYHAYIRPNASVISGVSYPGVWPDVDAGWPTVNEYVQGCIEVKEMCADMTALPKSGHSIN